MNRQHACETTVLNMSPHGKIVPQEQSVQNKCVEAMLVVLHANVEHAGMIGWLMEAIRCSSQWCSCVVRSSGC